MTLPTPVEFWNFNETRVGSILGIELTCGDAVDRYVSGKLGHAWSFDATANAVLQAAVPAGLFTPVKSISWAFWARFPTITTANKATVDFQGASGRVGYSYTYRTSLNQSGRSWVGNTGVSSANIVPRDINWHLLLFSYNIATGASQAWQDGTLTLGPNVVSWTGLPEEVTGISIGGDWAKTSLHLMELDAVGLWDVALTAADSIELYNAGTGWEYTELSPTFTVLEMRDGVDAGKQFAVGYDL